MIQKTFVLVCDSHFFYNHQFDLERRKEKKNKPTLLSKITPIKAPNFTFNTRTHLYQSDGKDEIATQFYSEIWADDKSITPKKKRAFDLTKILKLKYFGSKKISSLVHKIFHSIQEIKDFEKN